MDQNSPNPIQNTELAPDMKTLTCKVEKIIFHNENNKYTVMSVSRDDGRQFRLLGNIDSVKENDILKAIGSWIKDEKYGWQFKAESIEILSAEAERGELECIECKICEVRVLKAETGFASAKAECSDKRTVKLSGRLANICVGSMIRAYGKWTHDERFGDEFHVSKWKYQKENESASIAEEDFSQLDSSDLVIPDTVTTIADHAFEGCDDLLSVTIPDSVTSIGAGAFSGCKQLQSVTLPNSIEIIEEQTFSGCESLKTITIPSSVNRICKKAFEECVALSSVSISMAIDSIDKTAFTGCPTNIVYKTEEVDWEDITIIEKYIIISEPLGGELHVFNRNVDASMNPLLYYLSSKLPKLIVEYRLNSAPVILNPEVLHDAITLLSMKNDLSGFVRNQGNSSVILDTLDKRPSVSLKLFIPRDITPYLDFLYDKQDKDQYPMIPVEEYIGGLLEEGALFTVINKDQPYIIWENFNDSRATYVFPCTRDNYHERRQLIFDFIESDESNKRQFLRSNACLELFGAKPMMLVHNNFESWSTRLINMIETYNNKMEDERMANNEISQIYESAEQGDTDAQYNLGVCYASGVGVKQDYAEAVMWWRKAAEAGDTEAQCDLGICYANGEGVEQDYEEAVMWWRRAAEAGDTPAQYNLGVCYANGEGVEQDYEEAVKWWRKAAEAGDSQSQYKLGLSYTLGEGVPQDCSQALKWLRKAAGQGHEESVKALKDLDGDNTNDVTSNEPSVPEGWTSYSPEESARDNYLYEVEYFHNHHPDVNKGSRPLLQIAQVSAKALRDNNLNAAIAVCKVFAQAYEDGHNDDYAKTLGPMAKEALVEKDGYAAMEICHLFLQTLRQKENVS